MRYRENGGRRGCGYNIIVFSGPSNLIFFCLVLSCFVSVFIAISDFDFWHCNFPGAAFFWTLTFCVSESSDLVFFANS